MVRASVVAALLYAVFFVGAACQAKPMSIVIGIDGMGYGEYGFSVAKTPNMDSLINGAWASDYKGAYSDKGVAGGFPNTPTLQPTVSGPGWSTILTGVWVDKHNATDNSFRNVDFESNPTYLETLEENVAGLSSGSLVNWAPIDTHIIATADDGDSTVDVRSTFGSDVEVANAVATHITSLGADQPAAVFVHFDEVDGAGHAEGSGSSRFATEIEDTDGLVGKLLGAIKERPTFADEDWQVVIIADHGHTPTGGHGGQSELERTVPFIVSSKSLNPGGLAQVPQVVSQADVAPTVLEHFGVSIPGQYYGVSRAGGAFVGDADINGDGAVSGDGTGLIENDDVVAFVSFWLSRSIDSPVPADLNADGVVNLADWSILNAQNPAMGASIAATLGARSVPEPSTGAAGLLMVTCWAQFEWRRR